MPLLKKKKSTPPPPPPVDEEPQFSQPDPEPEPEEVKPSAHDEDLGALNEMEKKAADKANDELSRQLSLARLNETTDYVLENFNLKNRGFTVRGFDDKTSKIAISLGNGLFDVKITLLDPDSCGIFLDQ